MCLSKSKVLLFFILLLLYNSVLPMQIFVRSHIDNVFNRMYTLEVEQTDGIEDVRLLLPAKTGYPYAAHYQLYFGSTLLPDGPTLGDYGIAAESMLKLYLESSALPVELTSFTASANGSSVTLKWQTATEVSNYGFSVERRVKSEEWQKIAFVQGHGNSNSPKSYFFTDNLTHALAHNLVQYRLKQIDFDGQYEYSKVVEVNVEVPKEFKLEQNYPNPFNPETTIEYTIPVNVKSETAKVTLKVYDVLGREVVTLVDEYKSSGTYRTIFNISQLERSREMTSGIYFYRLQAGSYVETKKLLMMK